MEIIIDVREPDQIQPADGNDCSERWDAYRLDKKQILPEKLIADDETHRPKDTITAPSLPSLSIPSRTPIYDFFMLAAGKELGSEEKILRGPSPRRQFGTNKRLLKNFVSEAEELFACNFPIYHGPQHSLPLCSCSWAVDNTQSQQPRLHSPASSSPNQYLAERLEDED
jgi:hypothetical protein